MIFLSRFSISPSEKSFIPRFLFIRKNPGSVFLNRPAIASFMVSSISSSLPSAQGPSFRRSLKA